MGIVTSSEPIGNVTALWALWFALEMILGWMDFHIQRITLAPVKALARAGVQAPAWAPALMMALAPVKLRILMKLMTLIPTRVLAPVKLRILRKLMTLVP